MNACACTPAVAADVFERAVAPVPKQLRGGVFVADEEINPAVVVDVGPDGGLLLVTGLARPLDA